MGGGARAGRGRRGQVDRLSRYGVEGDREAEAALSEKLRESRQPIRPNTDPDITVAEYSERWLSIIGAATFRYSPNASPTSPRRSPASARPTLPRREEGEPVPEERDEEEDAGVSPDRVGDHGRHLVRVGPAPN